MEPSGDAPAVFLARQRLRLLPRTTTPPVFRGRTMPFWEPSTRKTTQNRRNARIFAPVLRFCTRRVYDPPRSKAPASQRKFAAVCAVRRYAKAGCHSSWRANPFGFAEACRRAGTACSKFRAIKRCGPLCGKLPTYGIFLCFAHFQQSVH